MDILEIRNEAAPITGPSRGIGKAISPGCALFPASPAASFLTGQTIVDDGGTQVSSPVG